MHIIEYEHNGGKASFDADAVFIHKATGDPYLRQSNGFLRPLSGAERAALSPVTKGAEAMPDLSALTKTELDAKAAEMGIELDRRKTKDDMLADFAAAWAEKHAS